MCLSLTECTLRARSRLVQFTIRPAREVMTLLDFIKPESDAPRSLWSTKVTLLVPPQFCWESVLIIFSV